MSEEPKDGLKVVARTERRKPIRVLLLDDREENLLLRAAILRQNGYEAVPAPSVAEAEAKLHDIDIAVLDYHLGEGFGTDVAQTLREKRPHVPIIILSATLERKFGGIADMHLLKGSSSTEDLIAALRHFAAKRRGKPVVIDARDFYYSRISRAMGKDVALEILDAEGDWQYVNDRFAELFEKKRAWFAGKNLFTTFPELNPEWREIVRTVAETRETYIDRGMRGIPHLPIEDERQVWNILVFPLKLADGSPGVVVSARVIEKKGF